MKVLTYGTSWCDACNAMADYLKRSYPDAQPRFVPVDKMPAETQARVMDALRQLTWSDQLPVTVVDDTVILGADYAALIAILGAGELPPAGNSQHRHGVAAAPSQEPAG